MELEFIPEAQRSLPDTNIRRRPDLQTCMLVAEEYRPPPDGGASPDHVAGGLVFDEAVALQKQLAARGYPTRIAVERYRVNVPLLALIRRVEIAGQTLRFYDELGRIVDRDARLLYHASAGLVGKRRCLDLFLTGPWTDYRIMDPDEPSARVVEERMGRPAERACGNLGDYDAYAMWELQKKASAVRSRSTGVVAGPASGPPPPPPAAR
jgi:hypothetical protein